MSNRIPNAPQNHRTMQAHSDRRSSYYMQNSNLNSQPPQFNQQQMFSPEVFYMAQQLLQTQQAQQIPFTHGPIPLGQMRWIPTQHLNMVGSPNDISSSRRYSCSVQNLVTNIPANRLGSNGMLNKPEQCHLVQDSMRIQQGAHVKNGPLAMHSKCISSPRLNFVGQRERVSPAPMKKARLHLKFSNLPPQFTSKDVIQQILGTDRMLVTYHGKPDISLRHGKDGSIFCLAQFINEVEAEKIRTFWNETQIMKGGEKLIVEYFDS